MSGKTTKIINRILSASGVQNIKSEARLIRKFYATVPQTEKGKFLTEVYEFHLNKTYKQHG